MSRRSRASVSILLLVAVLLTGCTGEEPPDIDDLGRRLAQDGNALLRQAKVLAPVNYDGRITTRDRDASRNVRCEQSDGVQRVFEAHGVGEYGSPARLGITGDTLVGILVQQDYEVDRDRALEERFLLWLSKDGGDLSFRIIVDDGEPVRWRVIGETRCVSAR